MKIKPIVWDEEPTKNGYTTLNGSTGIGVFTIAWKGWRENPTYDLEFNGNWVGGDFVSIDEGKLIAEEMYEKIINDCIAKD
jgi:hypothetical protein